MRYLRNTLQKGSHLWGSKLDGSYALSKPATRNPWRHYGNHWSSVNMTIVANYGMHTELATSNHLKFFNTHFSRNYMECFTNQLNDLKLNVMQSFPNIHKILWNGTEHSPGIIYYPWTSDLQFAAQVCAQHFKMLLKYLQIQAGLLPTTSPGPAIDSKLYFPEAVLHR